MKKAAKCAGGFLGNLYGFCLVQPHLPCANDTGKVKIKKEKKVL